MANGAGKKRRGAEAPNIDKTSPPRNKVTALELPGAPAASTRAEVSALQLPGAPPPRTQPAVDTTRRLHGVLAPSQATSLQLPGAPHQLRHAEVARRPLAIVPAHAHVPPQVDVAWFRSLLEVLRGRFPWPVVGRIIEALQGAWASVNAWWRGPPPEFAVLAVAAPELKKKKKEDKKKNKNKKPVAAPVRHHTAWMFKKDALPDDQKKKKKKDDIPPPPAAADEPQPSQRAPVPVIVDGVTVPAVIVERYKIYCRIAESCSATTTVCHLCIFEEELHPNGIVRTSKMIKHCSRHSSVAVRCGKFGCAVKVPPGLDLPRHIHFCHDLPADWWLP